MALGAQAKEPPNLIVVLVDDLRWDDIACAGHPFVKTPNIDRVAHEGARFRNAFATTPLCSPSRASLLTGRYTRHHGILDNTNRSAESHRLQTFPQALQKRGYRTAFIGKWHMGNDDSPRPGFDHWVCLQGQGTSFDPVLNRNGKRENFTGHTTDVLNQKALEFLGQKHEGPFCLYLSHKALHPELMQRDDGSISDPDAGRFLPAERHKNLYAEEAIPRRLNVLDSLEDKPALSRKIEGLGPLGPNTGTSDETIRDRLRMLAGVDEGLGQIMEELERTHRLDQTVIIFTSDHGYWYGEHGLSVERRLAYEEAIRIPLLIRYPKLVKPGRVIDDFALSIDLAPTLLGLARAESVSPMDGRSLVPLLQEDIPSDWRTSFLVEYNTETVFPRMVNMGYRAIRTKHWKYIQYQDLQGMDELYDLKHDPYEINNVIGSPSSETALKQLKADFKHLLASKPLHQNQLP